MAGEMIGRMMEAIDPEYVRIDSYANEAGRRAYRATHTRTGIVVEAVSGDTVPTLRLRCQARAAIEALRAEGWRDPDEAAEDRDAEARHVIRLADQDRE